MPILYKIAADFVVLLHASYVTFVVFGQLAILVGILRKWAWIRNRKFRWLHLAAIAIVVTESLLGIVCPLTTLEGWLRAQAGQTTYAGDFIAYWVHELMFYQASPAVFTGLYSAFGLIVLATFLFVPPVRRGRNVPSG